METVVLTAEKRRVAGRRANQYLRKHGRVPAIIYGHNEPPEPISLPAHELLHALEHGSRALKVKLGRKAQTVLIKDVQYDHLGVEPLHTDLARVDLTERIRVRVPIEYRGTPEGTHHGGQLEHHMVDIEIECLASRIPDHFVVRVDHLNVGESLHLRDVSAPEEITVAGHPEDVVCTVRLMAAAVAAEAEEAPQEESPAEPEVIGRGKEESGESKEE